MERRAGDALGPERNIESRLEDLVDAPEATVGRLFGFLDLDFDP